MSGKDVRDLAVIPGGRPNGWERLVSDFEASVQARGRRWLR
jgi:hypothetical protein